MAEVYTNIRIILDKLFRHPLMIDLPFESAVDYTVDFMRLVGAPNIFIEKTAILEVRNYRAALPCDFYKVIQVRTLKGGNNTFRASTDSFHMSECSHDKLSLTYKIQGNIIYTSIEKGDIEMAYRAIAVDDEGYPLIPDNSSFTRALGAYIKKEWYSILFDLGKISGAAYNNALREYAWAVGDCQTEFHRLSIDEAESFYNSWRTLLIRNNSHRTGFVSEGTKEIIKVHQ